VSPWTVGWILWLTAFAVLEGAALIRKAPGDTLSEHAWKWFATARPAGSGQPSGWVRFRRFSLLAGMAWLLAHFMTGGWV